MTVIDRNNYHLFQPLLYQVATAALPPADIAAPIRGVLRRQRNAEVLLGEVTGVDTERREVCVRGCAGAHDVSVPYEYLVIATGARGSYFGHDAWAPFAPGLKSLEDATAIRGRTLLAFEAAEQEMVVNPLKAYALLTFVIVGGGPTGVERAGAIAETVRKALAKDFRHIDRGAPPAGRGSPGPFGACSLRSPEAQPLRIVRILADSRRTLKNRSSAIYKISIYRQLSASVRDYPQRLSL